MSELAKSEENPTPYATLTFTRGAGEGYEEVPLQGVFASEEAGVMASTWGELQSDGRVFLMRHLIGGISYLDLPQSYAYKEIIETLHRFFMHNKKVIVDNVLSSAERLWAVCVNTNGILEELKVKEGQVVSFSDKISFDFSNLNSLIWERNSRGELVLSEWKLKPLYHKDFSRAGSPSDSPWSKTLIPVDDGNLRDFDALMAMLSYNGVSPSKEKGIPDE